MKKIIFFCMVSIILRSDSAYTEVPDQKPILDKKEEAMQVVIKGNQSFNAQRYDEAITFYKQAIALDPSSIDANFDLGVAYGKKGMLDESIAAYERVLAIDPNNAQAHNNLGGAYDIKGITDKAHSAYQKAAAADPNLAPAQYNLGKSFLARGSHEQAADHLYKAGILFHKNKNEEWATKSYDLLKKTNSREREKELYDLINADTAGQTKEKISK
jgi:Flp pilus assembly protein TadD